MLGETIEARTRPSNEPVQALLDNHQQLRKLAA